jgi:Flp pilus assembly protein TadG
MVELAIGILLLLLIVFGIIELGFAFFTKAMVTNAAREGARYAVTVDANDSSIKQRVKNYLTGAALTNITDDDITISPSVTVDPKSPLGGTQVTVTVTYNYSPLIPFIKGTPWNITSESVMRRE